MKLDAVRRALQWAAIAMGALTMPGLVKLHAADTYQPTLSSLEQYQVPDWYRDAKFGIFIHYGLFTHPGQGCWFGNWMYNGSNGDAQEEWFNANIGPMTGDANGYKWGYKDLAPDLTESNLDVDAWVDLFANAGAKFVVPVGLFHDSFAMYDSQYTRWNALNMGPHRDYITQLAAAARSRGLKFGVSNHFFENWGWFHHEADFDTGDPQYEDLYNVPESEYTAPSPAHCSNWLARAEEMVDKWHPDLMWFDAGIDNSALTSQRLTFAAYYYNAAVDWNTGVVLTYKLDAYTESAAVLDYERGQSGSIDPHPWETDTSSFNDWSYMPNAVYRTPLSLIQEMVDIVSKNGCLLLDFGPEADGTFPAQQTNILWTIGNWLATNGEAIYFTRPCFPFAEGSTVEPTGGFSDGVAFNSSDIRFTRNKTNDTIYAIGLAGPNGGQMVITSMKSGCFDASRVAAVSLLGGGNLAWSQDGAGLHVQVPVTNFSMPYAVKIAKQEGAANPLPAVAQQSPPAGGTVRGLSAIEVLFNEAVTNVQASDLLVGGAPATQVLQLAPNDYIFEFPAQPQGPAPIAFSPTQFIEDLGWNHFAGAQWTNFVDTNLATAGIEIDQEPLDAMVLAGQPVTFTVHAVSPGATAPVTYQWIKNGVSIANASASTFSVAAALPQDDGATYQCLARAPGSAAFAVSRQAILGVEQYPPLPASWLRFEGAYNDSAPTNTHIVTAVGNPAFENDVASAACGASSIYLPGDGSFVKVDDCSDLNFNTGSPFTLSAWIKTATGGIIVAKSPPGAIAGTGGTHTPAFYVQPDGTLRFDWFYVGTVISTSTVNSGAWTHVAATYDGVNTSLFINGQLDVSAVVVNGQAANEGANGEPPWSFTVGATLNHIFPDDYGAGDPFNGNIDEVAYWGSALGPGQIEFLVSQGVPDVTIDVSIQPADITALAGQAATFVTQAAVVGTNAQPAYQWLCNGVSIPGASNAVYTLPATSINDNGSTYQCRISLGAIEAFTRQALLTIVAPTAEGAPLLWMPLQGSLTDLGASTLAHRAVALSGTPIFAADAPTNGTAGAQSLFLASSNSGVLVTNVGDLDFDTASPFTLSAWIKTTTPGGVIAAKSPAGASVIAGSSGTHTPAFFVDTSGVLRYDVFYVSTVMSSASVASGQWTHVAVTYDGGAYQLYINGLPDGSASFDGANEGANGEGPWSFTIGETLNQMFPPASGGGGSFFGEIDGVAEWNTALSPAQIYEVFVSGVSWRPALIGTVAGSEIFLSWPGSGFVLQQSGSLDNSAHWTDVPGGDFPTNVTIGTGPEFFRLRSQ